MEYETFTWCPLIDAQGTSAFRVQQARFGDGYAQEVGDGINNEVRSWPVQFLGYEHQIQPIRDFLRRHGGFRPFWWKPPMEPEPLLFVAREIQLTAMGARVFRLSCTFEQRFAP